MIIGKALNYGPLRFSFSNRRRWTLCAAIFLSVITVFRDLKSHYHKPPSTVNLVLALTKEQDFSWTSSLKIPGLKILPYIADDATALLHPPANKGREALTYLTYLSQFYNSLPDISIFVHGNDITWHVDPIFGKSTANTLNLLNLYEVHRRGYLNLRTSWKGGCPAWINTTTSHEDSTSNLFFSKALHSSETRGEKFEEPYMKAAFEENFPGTRAPKILAQPCCSQFAVSKKTIRSIPRSDYQQKINWLLKSPLSDQLTGRMWEHMWQFLFLKRAEDCPAEYEALCSGWRICFKNQDELDNWNGLAEKVQELKSIADAAEINNREAGELEENLNRLRMEAARRGEARDREEVEVAVELI